MNARAAQISNQLSPPSTAAAAAAVATIESADLICNLSFREKYYRKPDQFDAHSAASMLEV